MMSNIISTVTGFGEKIAHIFHRTSYNVAELRSLVRVAHSGQIHNHVANKRLKLTPPEDSTASWLSEASFRTLVEANHAFVNKLHQAGNIVASHESRNAMNKVLQPLSHVLYKNPIDLQLLFAGKKDMCDAFFKHVENCIKVCNNIYEVGFFFRHKRSGPLVSLDAGYNFDAAVLEKLFLAQDFLSAAPFPTILNRILETGNAPPGELVTTDFIDGIILDLQALRANLPAPSFIASETYHGQVLQIFPRPARTDLDMHLLLPGSFPEDEEEALAPQEAETTPDEPTPGERTASHGPVGSSDLAIKKTANDKTARVRADMLESRISEITPEEFRSKFYVDSDAHRSIKETYISDFVAKEPPTPAEASKMMSSALRNRPKPAGKGTPKRFKMSRLPKTVRFTESTLSPQPRTHLGLDVPRLLEYDDESPGDEVPLNEFQAALRYLPGSAGKYRWPLSPNNIFSGKTSWVPEDDEEPGEPGKDVKVDPEVLIQELLDLPPIAGFELSDGIKNLLERQKSEAARKAAEDAKRVEKEARAAAEAAKLADEEARRAAEELRRRELIETLAKARELRAPLQAFIAPLSKISEQLVYATLEAQPSAIQAKSGDNTELRRHDFSTVIPPTQWVNDEIINGSISWVDRAINEAAGIKDVKKQTRKSLALNSFFFKKLLEKGPAGTERTLRRCGVTAENMLDVDTIFMPICQNSHWTLMVIRPSKRTLAHMDSLNPRGSSAYTNIAMTWVKHMLGDKFDDKEWKVERHAAPEQTNSYDCGVFTITNAMCLALGLSPIDSYKAKDMPLQRLRIAAMLKNGGFHGEFDLSIY